MTRNVPHVLARDYMPITAFMTVVMLAFISQFPPVIVAATAACAVYAYCASIDRRISRNTLASLVLWSLLFLPAFINYHHGWSPVFYLVSTVATFSAAAVVSNHPPAALLKAFECMYWSAVATVVYILYVYWDYSEPFGMVIEGSSTNGIPAYLIVLQVNLSLAAFLTRGRLPVISTVVTFIVAFFGNGRGSLVVSALIMTATFFLNVSASNHGAVKLRWFFGIFLLAVSIAAFVWGAQLLDLIIRHTKLSVGLIDENRLEILDQYVSKLDPFTFFWGSDYYGTVIDDKYGGNPHIAYIRTHSLFGLPITLLAMVSPFFVLFLRKPRAQKLVFFTFIGAAYLRAATEPLFFPTLLDLFYFLWFFMCLKYVGPNRDHRLKIFVPERGSPDCERRLR